jgi:predicted transcriptional regulator
MAKTRQKSDGLVSFYFRLPASLRQKIDDMAEKNMTSSARVATELIELGLKVEQTIDGITSDVVQAESDLDNHGREHISKWLKRN